MRSLYFNQVKGEGVDEELGKFGEEMGKNEGGEQY